jgi:hypothetical protein
LKKSMTSRSRGNPLIASSSSGMRGAA